MVKKILFCTITLLVMAFMAMSSDSAYARNPNMGQPGGYGMPARYGYPEFSPNRTRIGFGFNGIPFDGSHREATQMRREARMLRGR
ncbi:MAG: hypothetical protein Q4G69_09155 [Planctomycetia bacterium]|nr:hypothetical protein [Planctomycetia bacterium]